MVMLLFSMTMVREMKLAAYADAGYYMTMTMGAGSDCDDVSDGAMAMIAMSYDLQLLPVLPQPLLVLYDPTATTSY